MNFSSLMSAAILVIGLYGDSTGATRRSRQVPLRKAKLVPGETGRAARPLVLVKKRSALDGLDDMFEAKLIHRERRQYLQGPASDQIRSLIHRLSDHGTFNQDTYSCDDIISRHCQSLSDCDGCLGLFTCRMPQGTCDFKGISKSTGAFYQSLQGDQEADVGARYA